MYFVILDSFLHSGNEGREIMGKERRFKED
jgi:hypothetical protein